MEQAELNQIVDALTSILSPQLREIVNELVSVRIESSMQAVHLRVEDTEQRLTTAIDSVTGEARNLIGNAVAQLDATHGTFTKQLSDTTSAFESKTNAVESEISKSIRETEDRSESGRVEIERIVREEHDRVQQEFKAHASQLETVVSEAVKDISDKLVVLKAESNPVTEDADPNYDALCELINDVTESVKNHGEMLGTIKTAQTEHAKTLDAHGETLKSVQSEMVALQDAVDGKADKKSLDEKADKEIVVALSEHMNGFATSGESKVVELSKTVQTMVDSIAAISAALEDKADSTTVREQSAKLESIAREQEAGNATFDQQGVVLTQLRDSLENKVDLSKLDALQERMAVISEQLTLFPDTASLEAVVVAAREDLSRIATASAQQAEQRANELCSGIQESVDSQVRILLKAEDERFVTLVDRRLDDALPALAHAQVNTEFDVLATEINLKIDGQIVEWTMSIQENAAQAGIAAATKLIPDLVVQQLPELVDARIEHSMPDRVVATFEPMASKLRSDITSQLAEYDSVVKTVASEAGFAAAVENVPELVTTCVENVQTALINHAVEVAKAAAKADVAIAFGEFEPLLSERVEELASQVSLRTATATVPDLVDSRAVELTALVVQRATEQATEAASGAAVRAGEASGTAAGTAALADVLLRAESIAKEVAEPVAAASAKVAASALREELLAELDPTQRVKTAVASSIEELGSKLSLELGDAIGEATEKHIQGEVPRIQLELQARVQSYIDSIPLPKDGEDGEDGVISPTVPWEEGKKYKSGAWVSHANGIWLAARAWTETEPAADNRDWQCLISGLKNLTVAQEGDRVLRFVAEMTDGKQHVGEAYLNIPVVRGLYSDTYEYTPSDIVTHSGSSWVAQKKGLLARPGVNADEWKLQVKEGRKGASPEMPSRGERFKGTWKSNWLYHEGDVVEYVGFRWLAMRSTREQPIRSDDTWSKLGEGA